MHASTSLMTAHLRTLEACSGFGRSCVFLYHLLRISTTVMFASELGVITLFRWRTSSHFAHIMKVKRFPRRFMRFFFNCIDTNFKNDSASTELNVFAYVRFMPCLTSFLFFPLARSNWVQAIFWLLYPLPCVLFSTDPCWRSRDWCSGG